MTAETATEVSTLSPEQQLAQAQEQAALDEAQKEHLLGRVVALRMDLNTVLAKLHEVTAELESRTARKQPQDRRPAAKKAPVKKAAASRRAGKS